MNGQVAVITGSTGGIGEARHGYLEPADAPGIGVELDEKEMARHPYGKVPAPIRGRVGAARALAATGLAAVRRTRCL